MKQTRRQAEAVGFDMSTGMHLPERPKGVAGSSAAVLSTVSPSKSLSGQAVSSPKSEDEDEVICKESKRKPKSPSCPARRTLSAGHFLSLSLSWSVIPDTSSIPVAYAVLL